MKKSHISLAIGGLGIGTTEFVMMGLLPDISSSLRISIPEAGHLISAYALGVVIGAPTLVTFTAKYPPKRILLILMLIFTVFNALSALSSNYHTMLLARLLSGLPHGAFFGIGSVVAGRLAEKGKEAQAISIMFSGLTFANLLMVPLGTYIGHYFSWRLTFGVIALIGLLTLAAISLWMPALSSQNSGGIRSELNLFKRPEALLLILMTAIGTGGLFSWLSYIAPMMINVTRFDADWIPYIMILAGAGMVLGNFIGGKMADSMPPSRACLFILMGIVLCLSINYFAAPYKGATLFMTFVTGAVTFSLASPIQLLMIRTAKGAEMLGASLTQAAFNIGNALGAYWGGLPIDAGFSMASPLLVGIGMVLFGIVVLLLFNRTQKQKHEKQIALSENAY
ncbi:MFS transporter [Olivibacter sitiensis]|uniref:MFS transporter n=1 Tax=Olivibacter sitiensis TaxID=376470 RepID=UPI000428C1C4|nr:MFS transporter [Olivibacter sitiensis]